MEFKDKMENVVMNDSATPLTGSLSIGLSVSLFLTPSLPPSPSPARSNAWFHVPQLTSQMGFQPTTGIFTFF